MEEVPGEELGNGGRAEDGRGVAIGDAVDVGLNVLVGDDREGVFEGVAIGVGGEAVAAEVLDASIAGEDFGEDAALDLVGVGSDIFNELKALLVLLEEFVVVGGVGVWRSFFRHGCTLSLKEMVFGKRL